MFKNTILVFLFFLLFLSADILAQVKDRSEIDDNLKWNLNDLYPTVEDWQKAKNDLDAKISDITTYKGKLAENAGNLYYTLNISTNLLKDYYRLAVYSARLKDQNLLISDNESLNQEAASLGTKFSEISSFINPEILKIDPKIIDQFYNDKPELKDFKVAIDDIQRLRTHTLSEREEEILASFGQVTQTPADVYGTFNNAEMPYEKVKLASGEEIELSNSAFVRYRTNENREDRAKIFETFFNNYGKFKNTIGLNLAGKVRSDWIYAKNRNYKSSLEASLDNFAIPTSVYENLIKQIHSSLPTLHRFLDLKKKMLGVEKLHYYDLYTSVVEAVDLKYSLTEAQDIIKTSLKPMGEEYVSTVNKALTSQWIDYYPNKGKRSGAYSSGAAYDVHPYILMNWNDDYNSLSTLTHELGHTMHSYFSTQTQPFQYAGYSTFVAEIASTCNENLLNNYLLTQVKSDKEKLFLLGSYLELLRTTIFRQTSFAEFEWEIHKKVEKNEPLNGEIMSQIYYDIVKKYYGHDEGHCIVDDYMKYEWAYIPHFIGYNYYVYQYSTSLIYATAIAEKIVNEGQPAVEAYYNILKGGSSDYPINLIKKAGIDPLSSEPFELTMKKMNEVMDTIESILKK
ncbi:MAG: oligoendopeptidase F [Ignavibacteriae bacterium HGW-Ignavibacteriae-2]|jgi:oligoendopeptidase F|nr:MAG: oligoendopeptidase F [Ignavibacteriae bacterium HGW-Ignavibacteriae-2]